MADSLFAEQGLLVETELDTTNIYDSGKLTPRREVDLDRLRQYDPSYFTDPAQGRLFVGPIRFL